MELWWNWVYPYGRWNKVICTYKLFQGEWMWKAQTGACSPFWCTLIVFTRANGQCFISPIIVHQAKEYSEHLHFIILLKWTAHHTPYGYMDRYECIKAMTQFSNVCGAYPFNNNITFFCGHDSHFDDCAIIHMEHRNIQPFILKAGDSVNNQPNDNGLNSKLKSL